MNAKNKEEIELKSKYTGGALKVGRLHNYVIDLNLYRREENYKEIYYSLEEILREIDAYLVSAVGKKEGEKIVALWLKVREGMLNKKVPDGEDITNTLMLEFKLRRIIAKLNLDMEIKEKDIPIEGVIQE